MNPKKSIQDQPVSLELNVLMMIIMMRTMMMIMITSKLKEETKKLVNKLSMTLKIG